MISVILLPAIATLGVYAGDASPSTLFNKVDKEALVDVTMAFGSSTDILNLQDYVKTLPVNVTVWKRKTFTGNATAKYFIASGVRPEKMTSAPEATFQSGRLLAGFPHANSGAEFGPGIYFGNAQTAMFFAWHNSSQTRAWVAIVEVKQPHRMMTLAASEIFDGMDLVREYLAATRFPKDLPKDQRESSPWPADGDTSLFHWAPEIVKMRSFFESKGKTLGKGIIDWEKYFAYFEPHRQYVIVNEFYDLVDIDIAFVLQLDRASASPAILLV